MGWRDFQAAPPQDFMKSMGSMTVANPLIPFVPLIPKEAIPENRGRIYVPVELPGRGTCAELPPEAIKPFWASRSDMTTGEVIDPSVEQQHPDISFEITGGKHLSHYCEPGDAWCSAKLPGSGYPAGCVRINCEHQP